MFTLTDTTGIVVTMDAPQEAALAQARGLAGALRRPIDVRPTRPMPGVDPRVLGWRLHPIDAPRAMHAR